MSIKFVPLGIPISSSYAFSASYALTTNPATAPQTTSYAEYSINSIGPTGQTYMTISSSKVTILS